MTSKQNNCKNNGHLQLDEQGCQALPGTVQSCVEQDNRNNYLGEQQINFSIMGDQNQQTEVASNQEIHYAQEQLQDDRNRESLFESNNTEITLQSAASLPAVINSNAQEFLQQNSIILQPIYSEIKEDENIEEQIQQGKTIVNSDYFNYIISKSNAKNQFATPPPCTNLIDNSNTNSFSSSSGQQQHKPVNQENIYDVNGAGLGQEEVVITVADENNISNENNHKNNNNLASKNKHNFDSQGGIQNSFSLASEKQEGISGCISDKLSKEQKDDQASNLYSQESIPQHFICPITKDIMVQPVVLVSTGQIYERQAIQEWFQNGHRTCPVTGQTVASLMLQDLHPLRSAIYEFAGSAGIEMEHCEQVANSEEFSETTMHAQITAADLLNAYLTIRIREREQSQAGERVHVDPVSRRMSARSNTRGPRVTRTNLRVARQAMEQEEEYQRQQLAPQQHNNNNHGCRIISGWILAVVLLILYFGVFGYLIYATSTYMPALAVFLSILCVMLLICPPQVTRPWFLNLRQQQSSPPPHT